MTLDNFSDIIVGKAGFVVHRQSDALWHRSLTNKTHFLLSYASRGRAVYTVDNKEFCVGQGDLLFFNKGQAHSGYADKKDPWTYYTVSFELLNADGKSVNSFELPTITHLSNPEIFHNLYKTLYYEWNARTPGYELFCQSIIAELLCRLIRENRTGHKQSDVIDKIKKHLITHYRDNFSIEELAAMANISRSHFHRLFKDETGISAKQFLIRIRMNRAQSLLQSGEHNISEVADIVGYSDIYYFSRLFKKTTGVPPSAFIPK